MKDLKLIVLENAHHLGLLVDEHLKRINGCDESFIIKADSPRFSNGEGKVKICNSIREKDVYILADVGNYSITYNFREMLHYMAPDEHFMDVKRVIAASADHAKRVSVVMPLLYESRQHKRKGRESLDCALALQELENYNIKNLVTFDAHDPSVANAIPKMAFTNVFPTSKVLEKLYITDNDMVNNLLVLAPDVGALERARCYADLIGCDVGVFNKRRDYSKLVNGKNPIIAHDYLGSSMVDKNVIIIDDMIASGGSVIDVAREAKRRGAKNVIVCTTFALFTEGVEIFNKAYDEGLIARVYGTNTTYVPDEIKNLPWYVDVDCSEKIALMIDYLNKGKSLEPLMYDGNETYNKLRKLR